MTVAGPNGALTREREHTSSFLSENIKDGIYLVDAVTGKILHANQGLATIFGYTIAELEDMTVFELHLEENRADAMDAFRHISMGELDSHAFWTEDKNGGRICVEIKPVFVDLTDRKVIASSCRDITDRQLAQAEIEATYERFYSIFNHSNDGILVVDPSKDRILEANPRASEMLEFSREELMSLSISDLHPHELPRLAGFAESVVEQGTGWTNELSCKTKSGQLLASEISASKLDIDGKPCIVMMVRDVTLRKEVVEKLERRMQELTSLNRLFQTHLDQRADLEGSYDRLSDSVVKIAELMQSLGGVIEHLANEAQTARDRLPTPPDPAHLTG